MIPFCKFRQYLIREVCAYCFAFVRMLKLGYPGTGIGQIVRDKDIKYGQML